ncbi:MAG: hypothetical protein ACI9U2_004387 [Bradymonadia bacterium]|jgi:hypothetical protein
MCACGARNSRRVIKKAAPASAAPDSAPQWAQLPNPAAESVDVVGANEATQVAKGAFFADATDLFTLEQNHRASLAVTGQAERAQHAFWISRASGETATHRRVHCASARVFELANTAALTRDLRVADQWVLRVATTAKAQAGRTVALTWYRHIVKHHELAYIGRGEGGIALYQYVRPRPVPEGS